MASENELLGLLRQMPVFGGLSNTTLQIILNQTETVELPADEHYFREGDQAKSLFVLNSGSVVIEKNWQGVPVELKRLGPGDCFGEMAIIDLEVRSASVRTITGCQAMEITRVTLHQLFQKDTEQFAMIMMNMGREVSRRLRSTSEQLFAIEQAQPN